jgi:hypothetical protein
MAMNKANKTLIGILQSLVTTSGIRKKLAALYCRYSKYWRKDRTVTGLRALFSKKSSRSEFLKSKPINWSINWPNSIKTSDKKNPNQDERAVTLT